MLQHLIQNLQSLANPTQAAPMAAYLRNQFPILGIKTPVREAVVKAWLKEQPPAVDEQLLVWVQELYALPEREFQYAACDLLKAKGKKLDSNFWLPHLATFITSKSWWDTVDVWAPKIGAGTATRTRAKGYLPRPMDHIPQLLVTAVSFDLSAQLPKANGSSTSFFLLSKNDAQPGILRSKRDGVGTPFSQPSFPRRGYSLFN